MMRISILIILRLIHQLQNPILHHNNEYSTIQIILSVYPPCIEYLYSFLDENGKTKLSYQLAFLYFRALFQHMHFEFYSTTYSQGATLLPGMRCNFISTVVGVDELRKFMGRLPEAPFVHALMEH